MVAKSLKPVLILFFKIVPFSYIRTDPCIATVFLYCDIR